MTFSIRKEMMGRLFLQRLANADDSSFLGKSRIQMERQAVRIVQFAITSKLSTAA